MYNALICLVVKIQGCCLWVALLPAVVDTDI